MKKKRILRKISALFLVMILMVSSLSGVTFAATGDNVTIMFEPCYDKSGSVMKYNSGETIGGHYAGGKGENINRIFADGEPAFCIQPGVELHSGNQLKESSSDAWNALSSNKKKAIGLALLYGYSGNKKNLKGSDDEKWTATQVLIWEFVTGCRKATGAYKRSEKTIYSLYFGSSYANAGAKEVYEQIVDLLKVHNTIPSFMSEEKTEIMKDMKFKDGKYVVTLTDENKVLSDYKFSCSNDKINISKSGNKLTISLDEELEDSVRIKAVRNNVPAVSNSAKLLAYGSKELQDIVTGVENADDVKAFVNVQTKTGNLALKKTSEDGIVEGITFTIEGEDYKKTVKTGSDGAITLEDLVPGTYTVTEAVYDRYVPQKSQTVTVVGGKTAAVTFSNVLKKFNVTVKKKDAEMKTAQGNASLSGAVYGVYKGGKLIDKYTTDSNGEFKTSYYVCGDDWTIQEISPSEGYLLDKTSYPVGAEPKRYEVLYSNIELEVYERVTKGKIALTKHTDNGETGIETPEAGAEFEIYLKSAGSYKNAKETERDKLVCDKNGFAQTKEMPYGVYTVHQTLGWEGRELVSDFDVFISKNEETYYYILNNRDFESYIKVVKKDKETGKVIPYAGAGFQIYDPKGKLVKMKFTYPEVTTIDTFYTTEDGTLITPEPLPYGKGYSLVEVQAPYGYVADSNPVLFNVIQAESEKEEEITIIRVERPDMPQKGRITVKKTGEILSTVKTTGGETVEDDKKGTEFLNLYQPVYETKGLSGAVFEVTAAEDIVTGDGTLRYKKGDVVSNIITNEEGIAVTEPLYLGKFEVKEKVAPYGMVLNNEIHSVELTYAGQEIEITGTGTEFYNDRQKAQIDLSKVLEKNGKFGIGEKKEIMSVQFGLYADEDITAADGKVIPKDGLLEIISCDENGQAVFDTDIPVGAKLYVKEYSTDEHYILLEETYPVEFAYAGQDTALIKIKVNNGEAIKNDIIYGSVKGLKIERETGKSITGAVFGLFQAKESDFNEKTAIITAESGSDGIFSFENIPYGDWIVRELKPAKGFLQNNENYPVSITEDGQVLEITAVNDRIPEIGTTATVNGDKEINATEVFTLQDVVSYKHLIPGKEYVIKGMLMDKNTGKPLMINNKEVKSEIAFTPNQPTGKVTVSFTFDAKYIKSDTKIVAFETLYLEDMELVAHADIKDQRQTVTVHVPKIGTEAFTNGKKKVTAEKKITIDDMVSYKNLTPGKEYTIEGVLMNKKTGKPFLVDGKEVRSKAVFKPKEEKGKVKVSFIFDASGITKETEIVVFETLYRDGVELTAHADIKDKGQTVAIEPPTPNIPQTGDNSMTGFWIGLGAIALGGVISLFIIKKKNDEECE